MSEQITHVCEMTAETVVLKTDLASIWTEYGSIVTFQEKMARECAKYGLQGSIIADPDDFHMIVRFQRF